MKRLFLILTTLFVAAFAAKAQEPVSDADSVVVSVTPSVSAITEDNSSNNFNYARVMTDVGKSVTFIGCSFVYTAAAYLTSMKLDTRHDSGQIFGGIFVSAIGLGYGAIIAGAGLLSWIPGEIILSTNGLAPTRYTDDKTKRLEVMLDVSYANALMAETAVGYNFSRHFFLGAGASYNYHFTRTETTHDYLPVFVRGRVTVGSHLVRPYFDVDLGVDALDGSLYYSTGMGAKWRLSSNQNFITLGTSMNACAHSLDLQLRLGYIF